MAGEYDVPAANFQAHVAGTAALLAAHGAHFTLGCYFQVLSPMVFLSPEPMILLVCARN